MQNGRVVVQDDKILAFGEESQVDLDSNTPVVDVGDRTVMPGIIDAHVHMLSTGGVASGGDRYMSISSNRRRTDCAILWVPARART